MKLTSQNRIKQLFEQFHVTPLKSLGQNFLTDENVLQKIVETANISGDNVLEIGPGLGALTGELCRRAKKVAAVEIDKGMTGILEHTLSEFGNVEIIHADILKLDLADLPFAGEKFSVAANLPYYITTPVIMKLLQCADIKAMTFLVQNEVAQRMAAEPGSKHYGSLSIALQYICDFSYCFKVPPSCFYPKPAVDSAVVRIVPRKSAITPGDESWFFTLVRGAFAMRRKTLSNNLLQMGISRSATETALRSMGIDVNTRGEQLTAAQYIALSECLKPENIQNRE